MPVVTHNLITLSLNIRALAKYTRTICYNIHATFFQLGRYIELYPETARMVSDAGHLIVNARLCLCHTR